jgi:hypothetical protein
MINRLLYKVSKAYLDEYGCDTTRFSPRMTAEAVTRILNSVKTVDISFLQARMKRQPQREIQILLHWQEERQAKQQAAFMLLYHFYKQE